MPKINFQKIANRLTGISTPIFGVSWEPSTLEIEIAEKLITYFEDRRVLYMPYNEESIHYANRSILDIRKRLTADLEQIDRKSKLALLLSEMRTECRTFLQSTNSIPSNPNRYYDIWDRAAINYFVALGELRARMGIYIAQLAVMYGIDVEPQLAQIFPSEPEGDTQTHQD